MDDAAGKLLLGAASRFAARFEEATLSDLLAYEAADGSLEAFLFGPGSSSAYRDRDGIWTSPAPAISPDALAKAFLRVDDAEAETMNWQVACAMTDPEPQRPRASPAKLLEAAKDLQARRGAAKAIDKPKQSAKPKPLVFGSKAWGDAFARRFSAQARQAGEGDGTT